MRRSRSLALRQRSRRWRTAADLVRGRFIAIPLSLEKVALTQELKLKLSGLENEKMRFFMFGPRLFLALFRAVKPRVARALEDLCAVEHTVGTETPIAHYITCAFEFCFDVQKTLVGIFFWRGGGCLQCDDARAFDDETLANRRGVLTKSHDHLRTVEIEYDVLRFLCESMSGHFG